MESTVTSTEAKNQWSRILAEVERTGASMTITNRGRPVAKLVPLQLAARIFGQLPHLTVPLDFDEPLPEAERSAWGGAEAL